MPLLVNRRPVLDRLNIQAIRRLADTSRSLAVTRYAV